jgi:hypothetical protein
VARPLAAAVAVAVVIGGAAQVAAASTVTRPDASRAAGRASTDRASVDSAAVAVPGWADRVVSLGDRPESLAATVKDRAPARSLVIVSGWTRTGTPSAVSGRISVAGAAGSSAFSAGSRWRRLLVGFRAPRALSRIALRTTLTGHGSVRFAGLSVRVVPAGTQPVLSGGRLTFADGFLSGIPNTSETNQNLTFLNAWMTAESGADTGSSTLAPCAYNPLNTEQTEAGSTQCPIVTTATVQSFPNITEGIEANVTAVTNGLYNTTIVPAVQNGSCAVNDAQAVANSPWGTGQLVLEILAGWGYTTCPILTSFKSSVGSVGFGGGSVTLSAAGSGATSFAFSSSLSGVSGLGTVSSSDGSASDVVSIPENTSLSSRSVSFTVTASASGQTPASASLTVSQAGDPPPAVSSVSVPSVAVADTSVSLSASASDAGGTITGYEWDFGDGQTASTAKPDVTHVFADPQIADVSVTVTDSHGHTATGTGSVDVAAASSAVSTRPATSGIRQHLFYIAPSTRAVSQEYWSGTAWSSQALVSGSAAGAGSAVTSLTYPDSTGLQAQHAFYVGPGDGLDEDYWTGSAWEENVLQDSSVTAADRPAAGSDLVGVLSVTANVIEPHVFYIDNAGGLAQDYVNQSTGDWETQTLAGSPAAGTHLAASAYATSDGHIQLHVFYVSTSGDLAETYYAPGPGWASKAVTGSLTPAAGTALSSTDSGADGANENVFFTDTAGNLARAAYDGTTWTMTAITASHPAASSAIISANYLTAGQLDLEVYYLNGSGDVEQDYSADAGASWSNQTIGNGTVTAATLLGVGDYPIPDQDQHVFYATAAGTIYQDYGNTSNWTNQPIS